jgi:asparagine synthase (glutamine-hydrolysing)
MCGINGIINWQKSKNNQIHNFLKTKIEIMQQATAHRGPDEQHKIIGHNFALGINRLAILDTKRKTKIAHPSYSGLYMVYNGEIINFKKLKELLSEEKRPQIKNDTDIILPLFNQFGQSFIKKLAGMFAIAIYDEYSKKLQLWRDPLGIKPLYYYRDENYLFFSSEIKAIYQALDKKLEPSFSAIDHILQHRFQPSKTTIFSKIKKVLPGETISFDKTGEKSWRYWRWSDNNEQLEKNLSPQDLQNLLLEVITEYTEADVKGGIFVSGGLDSSIIASLALQVPTSAYKQPISLRFSPQPVEDQHYASILERYLKIKFEWVTISDELARTTLLNLIPFLDEPLENPTHVGTYLMSQRAKEIGIKSVLTGDGSDELFLGYKRHACWFNHPQPAAIYPSLCWTLSPDEANQLYTQKAKIQQTPIINGQNNKIEPLLNIKKALLFERGERLPEYHNMRLDRMTMSHGVEAKVPFQDHRIAEHSLRIPRELLFGQKGKEWLQKAAINIIPKEIIHRKKVLFPSLPDQWLGGKKGYEFAAQILLDQNAHTKTWLKPKVVEKYLQEHQKNIKLRGKLLWAMIVLELWLQHLTQIKL